MELNKYLSSYVAPSVSELRQALVALGYDVKSNAQIRQWRKAYQGRRPSPENCAGLEQVTKGATSLRQFTLSGQQRLIGFEL